MEYIGNNLGNTSDLYGHLSQDQDIIDRKYQEFLLCATMEVSPETCPNPNWYGALSDWETYYKPQPGAEVNMAMNLRTGILRTVLSMPR